VSALQAGTSCLLREDNSGEIRYNQILTQRGKEVFITVKGGFTITSNAIENLVVTIDGVPYHSQELFGRQPASFPDAETVPPPPPAAKAPAKSAPSKTGNRPR